MSIAYVPNTAKNRRKMKELIERRLQELEQIRRNLLYNASCSDDLGKAYQQMAIEIVESCQKVLKDVLRAEFTENRMGSENSPE